MEKINTPLGELLETFTEWELQIEGNEKPGDVMASVISFIESKLKAEREVIEKSYDAGANQEVRCVANGKDKKCYCTSQIHCEHKYIVSPQDYFNETFKSYE